MSGATKEKVGYEKKRRLIDPGIIPPRGGQAQRCQHEQHAEGAPSLAISKAPLKIAWRTHHFCPGKVVFVVIVIINVATGHIRMWQCC
jgi:hypothetical protein